MALIRWFDDLSTLEFMRDDPLEYTITDSAREGVVIIKLTGPLTLSNMFTFQSELRTLQPHFAIFDLSESEYMDSAGLGVLVNFYTSAAKNGRRMALAGVNNRIEALLDMTHVKSLLGFYPTVAAAEAAV